MMWSQPGLNQSYFGPANQEANGALAARPMNLPKINPFLSPQLQSLSLLSPWFASSNANQQLPRQLAADGSSNNNLKQQGLVDNSSGGIAAAPPICMAPPSRSGYPPISSLPSNGGGLGAGNPLQLNGMFGADGTTYSPHTPSLLVASLAPKLLQKSPAHKKRVLPDSTSFANGGEFVERPVPTKVTQQATKKLKKSPNPDLSLNGERRLIINFENFGTRGEYPQTFGKARRLVPDGLSGTHTLYSERWHFKVEHSPVVEDNEGRHVVCLVWEITNLTTLHVTLRKETLDEALERMNNGRTITNDVFRAAMEDRAKSLEAVASNEKNEAQATNILCRVKALRPRCFNQGILVFGLQHRIVQEKLDHPINFGFHERPDLEQEDPDDEETEGQ